MLSRTSENRIVAASLQVVRFASELELQDVMSREPFQGVGLWYRDFSQTTDEQVCYLLKHAKEPPRKHPA